jgi:hypothetical protein
MVRSTVEIRALRSAAAIIIIMIIIIIIVFLFRTYVSLPRSIAPSADALQLDVLLLPMQLVNLQIILETRV